MQSTPAGKVMRLAHPSRAVITLRIIAAPERCAIPGLIGLECYTDYGEVDLAANEAGLIIGGSSGNLRYSDDGELLGDGIFAAIPPGNIEAARSGNYSQPAPPYTNRRVDS